MTTRIIASMDTGVDDALALAYLLAAQQSGACELLGVLASYGNVDASCAERNTRYVLDLFGHPEIPVFRGADHPSWADSFIPDAGCAQFHGVDGLGGFGPTSLSTTVCTPVTAATQPATKTPAAGGIVSIGGYTVDDPHANPARPAPQLLQPPAPPSSDVRQRTSIIDDGSAHVAADTLSNTDTNCPSNNFNATNDSGITAIIDVVRRWGHNVTVLATGPLTDVDAAIQQAPDIAGNLRLVMMGGSLTQPGNCWDAVAETNILQDPEAADRVFHCGADITMVGLDVTHQCLLGDAATQHWRNQAISSQHANRLQFLADIADFSIAANRASDAQLFAAGMPMHDPLAAAVALDPTLVTTVDLALRAETRSGDFTGVRGRTTGDPVGLINPALPRVHVALQVDSERFLTTITNQLTTLG
ncbi:nucleoside hydrolase [Bifidobacterium oedipodis]|uniref:Nucleoside hydrolase n=1 Tax=Bifidobacterium oedipodis TaxID=2675322 RepID=A0A7Y0HSG8_9BIFI|nr:nucleoside hydrolase [Bifidobacterium sp. DSM 109957]NMM94006.1 nucleoside hydrolase [Bifidobacterium sp. DSM 109957]